MQIELILYASLADYLPEGSNGNVCNVETESGKTIADILQRFSVPLTAPKIIFVNGIHAKLDRELQDGDRVALFPPIAGG